MLICSVLSIPGAIQHQSRYKYRRVRHIAGVFGSSIHDDHYRNREKLSKYHPQPPSRTIIASISRHSCQEPIAATNRKMDQKTARSHHRHIYQNSDISVWSRLSFGPQSLLRASWKGSQISFDHCTMRFWTLFGERGDRLWPTQIKVCTLVTLSAAILDIVFQVRGLTHQSRE